MAKIIVTIAFISLYLIYEESFSPVPSIIELVCAIEHTPPKEQSVATNTIPILLLNEVCFNENNPDVISSIDESINDRSSFKKLIFNIQVDKIEKIIIYPPILNMFSNEFRMHLSIKLKLVSVFCVEEIPKTSAFFDCFFVLNLLFNPRYIKLTIIGDTNTIKIVV